MPASISYQLKISFENVVGITRGNSAQDSYDYAERVRKSLLIELQKELDVIAEGLRQTSDIELAIKKLESFTESREQD